MSRVPASPHFFRPVKRAFVAGAAILCLLAVWFPAPLEVAADPARPPNPAKSAWFLVWIQELVSYNTLAIYAAVVAAMILLVLPWAPTRSVEHAAWFQRGHRLGAVLALVTFFAVLALTIVGLFFRGADWCLVAPF